MTLEELMSKNGSDEAASYTIANALREAIFIGLLEENEPLHQSQLASQLGVSPIPFREALRQLESEGLVEFRGRRGAIVSGLTYEDAREIYDMMIWIELGMLPLAFENIGKQIISNAEKLLDNMEAETDLLKWRDMNVTFHAMIYEPADRPKALEMLTRLRGQVDRYIRSHLDSMRRESEQQHRQILKAIADRDLDAAAEAMRNHLESTSKDLQAWMRIRERYKKSSKS